MKKMLSDCGFGAVSVYARGNAVTVACYKAIALIVPVVFPQRKNIVGKAALFALSIPLLPLLLLLGVIANVSLAGEGGDDCLGYTAFARKPAST
jgi:hypothetical protein